MWAFRTWLISLLKFAVVKKKKIRLLYKQGFASVIVTISIASKQNCNDNF